MHRPRLFQTFSRSKEQRASPDSGYDERDYGYYNQYEHKDERASAWRKVLSRKPREESNRPAWEEEVVEYPSRAASYAPDAYSANSQRYARDPYAGEHTDSRAYMEDRYENDRSSFSDPVPIVQRENSLTRMRDMFTDPNRASHAVTDIPLPANTNRYTVADSQSPVEVHNTHPSRHQPVIINNTPTHSVRPDMDYTHELSERARGKRPDYRSRRDSSPDSYDRLSNENEYPPCVVVVERGRHGKPDKYYIIPGGAPVIFEDEHGKELTRVGDFSGRYRPQKPTRPVIIEDEYGREVYRMGFDSDDSSSRNKDGFYSRSGRRDYDDYHRDDYSKRSYSSSDSRYESSRRHDDRHSSSRRDSPRVYAPDEYAHSSRSSPSAYAPDEYASSRRESPRVHRPEEYSSSRGSPRAYGPEEYSSSRGSPRVYGPEEYSSSRHGPSRAYGHEEYKKYSDDRNSSRRSEGTSRSTSPKVVYIDPSVENDSGSRSRGRSSSHATHSSSRRHGRRDHEERAPHPADYNVGGIHVDETPRSVHSPRRSPTGSASSTEFSHHD